MNNELSVAEIEHNKKIIEELDKYIYDVDGDGKPLLREKESIKQRPQIA